MDTLASNCTGDDCPCQNTPSLQYKVWETKRPAGYDTCDMNRNQSNSYTGVKSAASGDAQHSRKKAIGVTISTQTEKEWERESYSPLQLPPSTSVSLPKLDARKKKPRVLKGKPNNKIKREIKVPARIKRSRAGVELSDNHRVQNARPKKTYDESPIAEESNATVTTRPNRPQFPKPAFEIALKSPKHASTHTNYRRKSKINPDEWVKRLFPEYAKPEQQEKVDSSCVPTALPKISAPETKTESGDKAFQSSNIKTKFRINPGEVDDRLCTDSAKPENPDRNTAEDGGNTTKLPQIIGKL